MPLTRMIPSTAAARPASSCNDQTCSHHGAVLPLLSLWTTYLPRYLAKVVRASQDTRPRSPARYRSVPPVHVLPPPGGWFRGGSVGIMQEQRRVCTYSFQELQLPFGAAEVPTTTYYLGIGLAVPRGAAGGRSLARVCHDMTAIFEAALHTIPKVPYLYKVRKNSGILSTSISSGFVCMLV